MMKPVRHFLQALLILLVAALFYLGGCSPVPPAVTPSPLPSSTLPPSDTPTPTLLPTETASPAPTPEVTRPAASELFIFSILEQGHAHLFAYSPLTLPLTRLTYGQWDDITPAISPDGNRVAFSSRRNGYWDLYLLDLQDGRIERLTDTLAYDASPSWSPDGNWIVYETYTNDNLEIAILPLQNVSQGPILLTDDPAADHSPRWSPGGRQIAFVSNRSGESEIWVADLDRVGGERFTNLSQDPRNEQAAPAWSPDASQLGWTMFESDTGFRSLRISDPARPGLASNRLASGESPLWNGPGDQIAALVSTPLETHLIVYTQDGSLVLPPTRLPGPVRGYDWKQASLAQPLPGPLALAAQAQPSPRWTQVVSALVEGPAGRVGIVPVEDVQAPFPSLSDSTDEAFQSLRLHSSLSLGWDALANLQNAFVPLTTPLDPGQGDSWLYTGRAISLNPVLINAGWLVTVREDFNSHTYWRVYLRTIAQDGSQGEPLHRVPWDLNARFTLDPRIYEQGGRLSERIPGGYWVDFTDLAGQLGWRRLPALSNWRTYFNGTRFGEFVLAEDLDWRTAMLEIYPPEVLITPTAIIPPTRTPTRTPWGFQTPTPTLTPTPNPTFTPSP